MDKDVRRLSCDLLGQVALRAEGIQMPEMIVKVGGSLYDLPDLAEHLRRWLDGHAGMRPLLVPGGGATADVVRSFHRTHGLGEEACHWLALRALSLNAYFLADLVGRAAVVEQWDACPSVWADGRLPVLDLHAFALQDEHHGGRLPHCWAVTSDALAARVAVVAGARDLVLLKSISIPADISWEEAGRRGFVDAAFAGVLRTAAQLEVRAVNFRATPQGPTA
jgi:aspartokinase-like uncharacterized kinase